MVHEVHHMMTGLNAVTVTDQVLAMMREEVQDMIMTPRGIVTMVEALFVLVLSMIGDGKIGFPMGEILMIVGVLTEKVSLTSDLQITKRMLVCPAFQLYGLLGRYWEKMLCHFALVSLQKLIAAGLLMGLKLPR